MRYQRRKVIEELMNTERDYVKLLQNLVEGFVEQCRRRSEMFNEERIRKIFANIEQLTLLHSKLLRELELSFDQKSPDSSCVASAFLRNVSLTLICSYNFILEPKFQCLYGILQQPVGFVCRVVSARKESPISSLL
jgi:hypothetical protein